MKKIGKGVHSGITLIALIITIIVLLILAGVTINILVGDNGILNQTQKAKEQTDISTIKERTEMDLLSMDFDENGQNRNFTVSEKIDKLKEDGILNDDMTFKSNSAYKMNYNGNIVDANGNILNTITLSNDIKSIEVDVPGTAGVATGKRNVKVINGSVTKLDTPDSIYADRRPLFNITANPAPEGYKFGYWVDQSNRIFSYNVNEIKIAIITDMQFTAVYVKEIETITPEVCVNIYATTETQENKLQFQSLAKMPFDELIYEQTSGLLATNNANFANENYMTIDKETNTSNSSELFYKKKVDGTSSNISYCWYKSNVGNDTWYVRGYSIITNKQTGETQTYYSNIISAHK